MKQSQNDTIALLNRALAGDFRLVPLFTPDSPVFLAVAWPVNAAVTGRKPRLPGGRGLTLHQALIAAGAEALELRASLAQRHLADLAACPRLDGIAMVAALDLRTGETVPLPAQEVYLDGAATLDERQIADANSTGCAVGATRDAAINAAVWECVERDAVALWWHGGVPAGPCPLDLIDTLHPRLYWWLCQRLRTTRLLDLTTDIGLPVVAAISANPDGRFVAMGAAARPLLAEAAHAAVTEMVQTEVSMDEARTAGDPELAAWSAFAALGEQAQFRAGDDKPHPAHPLRLDDLLQRLGDLGHRSLAVEMTLPGDPMPTMRVLVPGLCAMQRRFDTRRFHRLCADRGATDIPEPF